MASPFSQPIIQFGSSDLEILISSSCPAPSFISLFQEPMDPPHGCRPWRPCLLHHPHHHLHHHHHHHPLFLCPHHHRHHHLHHQNNRTLFNCHVHTNFAPFPQNPEHSSAAAAAIPFQTHSISETSRYEEAYNYDSTLNPFQVFNFTIYIGFSSF